MPFLSPAKILVILVVALIVLGPDKLPKMAKQMGGFWGDFRKFREKIESDVRGSFPDLPSTDTIAHAVRSPLSFLDNLADTHAAEQGSPSGEASGSESRGAPDDASPAPTADPVSDGPPVTAAPAPSLPGISIADPGGVVHQVRASGVMVPDDPGLN